MRILLVDHGCCDHPHTRVHTLRAELGTLGVEANVCGPSSVPGLERQPAGMHGIHLHDVAAASRPLLAAVREGSAEAFLAAVGAVPARLLGLVRETARQTIAEATDSSDPDAIRVSADFELESYPTLFQTTYADGSGCMDVRVRAWNGETWTNQGP